MRLLFNITDTLKPHFFDQPVLQCLIGTLYRLCLRLLAWIGSMPSVFIARVN